MVGPLVLELSGPLLPHSIVDQMVRATILIRHAIQAEIIAPHRPLLVIGAGVTGVAAALEAAKLNVPTLLLEADREPFRLQSQCSTRHIDPTEYAWPLPHYAAGSFPIEGDAPLRWQRGPSQEIAKTWSQQLEEKRAASGDRLMVIYEAKLDGMPSEVPAYDPSDRPYVDVKLPAFVMAQMGASPASPPFGMIALARGMGTEQVKCTRYRGYRYWQTDPFGSKDLGLPGVEARVLISGGGDGALQDCLRVLTGRSAGAILTALELNQTVDRARLLHAEEHAMRQSIWALSSQTHEIETRLQRTYLQVLEALVADAAAWAAVCDRLAQLLRDPLPRVELVYPCDHFSRCFSLNRFLVLLVDRFLQERRGYTILLPNLRLVQVSPRGHCCSDPESCHGQLHEVVFLPKACRRRGSATPKLATYNVLILRHGLDPAPGWQGTQSLRPQRQLLPPYPDVP